MVNKDVQHNKMTTSNNPDSLYYRRQFLMSSVELDKFPLWNKARISNHFFLRIHPDLELTQVNETNIELTLLGYIIDPDHHERNNHDILQNILLQGTSHEKLFKQTSRFSGRWILILSNNEGTILFNDPTGLRSVYYTDFNIEPFCCASQPKLIADILNYSYSEEAKNDFLNSSYCMNDKEYWWPSGTSLYKEIKHLVPNHYINLFKKETKRFWPLESIKPLNMQDGVIQASALLKKHVKSASSRYELALPVTAGVDSRSLLAATKEIADQVYYYTLIYYDLNYRSHDIVIPKQLLSNLKLQHHILDCSSPMDENFKSIYMGNVGNAHEAWGDIAFGLQKHYPDDKLCVRGNCSEIARWFYYKSEYPKEINGKILAELAGMRDNKFAVSHFGKWLHDSQAIAEETKIDILDLFYWEHRSGSWQAMSQLEWDIVQEAYTPYNCRDLLSILLATNKGYRKPPRYKLYEDMIRTLWPELLSEPINPEPFIYKFKSPLKKLLKTTGTYAFIKRVSNRGK